MNNRNNIGASLNLGKIYRNVVLFALVLFVLAKPLSLAISFVLNDDVTISLNIQDHENSEDDSEKDDVKEDVEEKSFHEQLKNVDITQYSCYKGQGIVSSQKHFFSDFHPGILIPPPELG